MTESRPPEQPDSEQPDSEQPAPDQPAESDWQRRRRLAAVFGDVLPETTSDERDPDPAPDEDADSWLRSQVPPHHG
jgi:hypothetical protein